MPLPFVISADNQRISKNQEIIKAKKRTIQNLSRKKVNTAVKRESSKNNSKKRDASIWRFFISYLIFIALFLLLIGYKPVKEILDINGIYTRMIIFLTATCLKPVGIIQEIKGSIIHLKGISLDVRFGCNGLEAFFIYIAAILSFPASKKKKLFGILIGFLIIQGLNILRIAALCLCAVYLKKYFYYFHIYVAQGIMIAFALILFLFWLNYAAEK